MSGSGITGPVAPANLPIGAEKTPKVGKIAPAPQKKMGNPGGGGGGKKKASEIIQNYVMQQTGSQEQVAQVMGILDNLIKKRLSRLIQFGNTVFWATQAGRGTIDVHIFSEESPKEMVGRMQQAYQWAKQHGFTRITSTLTDNQQLGVVKAAGLPYTLKPTQVNTGKQMMPAQIMVMEVK